MKKTKYLLSYITAPAILLASSVAVAAPTTITPPSGFEGGGANSVPTIINGILSWALGIAGLLAVAFIIVGGFNYITSSGNEKKVTAAKNSIIYAVIGLIVVALAFAIKAFVMTRILGADVAPKI